MVSAPPSTRKIRRRSVRVHRTKMGVLVFIETLILPRPPVLLMTGKFCKPARCRSAVLGALQRAVGIRAHASLQARSMASTHAVPWAPTVRTAAETIGDLAHVSEMPSSVHLRNGPKVRREVANISRSKNTAGMDAGLCLNSGCAALNSFPLAMP